MPEFKNSGPGGSRNPDPGVQSTIRRELSKLGHAGSVPTPPQVSLRDPLAGVSILGSGGGIYRVLEPLGIGGMGTVYTAEQALEGGSNKAVAVKFLSHQFSQDKELRERFRKEAETMGRIDHPNVVKILDTGALENGDPFFVMEHIKGEDLDKILARRKHLPWKEARPILLQVSDGLHAVHSAGIVHRDLKPSNIRIEEGTGRAMLMDFGVAKHLQSEHKLTMTGTALGTPAFMSPEQAGGSKQLDQRADIYSFCAVAYHALTGSLVFDGDSLQETMFKQATESPVPPRQRRPDLNIPGEAEALIMCGLAKDPKARYQSMVEVKEALLKCGEGAQQAAFPPPEFDKKGLMHETEGFFTRRVVAVIAGAVAIVILGAAAFFGFQKYHYNHKQTTYLKADGTGNK